MFDNSRSTSLYTKAIFKYPSIQLGSLFLSLPIEGARELPLEAECWTGQNWEGSGVTIDCIN